MGKAMKAMKATKAMKTSGSKVMTASAAYRAVAESTGVKPRDVKGALEAYVGLAAEQIKKNGSFKLCGVNPFTKEPCVFKAKPASKTVRALPLKKFKEMMNCESARAAVSCLARPVVEQVCDRLAPRLLQI